MHADFRLKAIVFEYGLDKKIARKQLQTHNKLKDLPLAKSG